MARSAIDILINATDRASSTIKGVNSSIDSMVNKAERAGTLANGALLAMGAGMGIALVEGVKYNSMLETSESRWTTLLKSSSEAEKQMAWIKDYAKTTPFDYKGIDATATSLMGMGMELEDVHKWLPTIGDGVAVLGGGTETFNNIGRALGQMTAKGKVSAEEMMQLAENGINGWQMIADGMGLSVAEVMKLSQEGKLLASDALPLIQQGMEKAFGGGTQQLMTSTTGQAMQAQENFSELAGTLTQGAFNYFGANVLPLINSGLASLTSLFGGGLLSGFQNLWNSSTQAKIGLLALATMITAVLIVALVNLAVAVAPVIVAFAPFIAIGAVIVGVVALLIANWSKLAPFFTSSFSAIKNVAQGFITGFIGAFQNLMGSVGPIWESLKTLFNTLKPVLVAVGVAIAGFLVIALAVFNGVVSAFGPMVAAFLNLVDVVLNVVLAIGALLMGDYQGFLNFWNKATQSSINFFKNLWNGIKGFFSGFWSTITAIASNFGVNLNAIFASLWARAKAIFQSALQAVLQYFSNVKARAVASVQSMRSAVVAGFQAMMSFARSVISGGLAYIQGRWNALRAMFVSVTSAIANAVRSGFQRMISFARSVISSGISFIISLFRRLQSMVVSVVSAIASRVQSGFQRMISVARSVVSAGINFIVSLFRRLQSMVVSVITTIASRVQSGFQRMISMARSIVSSGISFIISLFTRMGSQIVSTVTSVASRLVSTFTSMMSRAKSAVSGGLSQMIGAVRGYVGQFLGAGKALLEALASGIKSGIDKAVGAVKSGMEKVRSYLPFSPAKEGPLKDLDKSGESFFPTWAKGALSQTSSVARSVGRAMSDIGEAVDGSPIGPTLDAFTGGGRVTVVHEVRGRVEVRGDNGDKVVLTKTAESVEEQIFMDGFRQAMRKNKR